MLFLGEDAESFSVMSVYLTYCSTRHHVFDGRYGDSLNLQ
jgi:hypothetical protein